MIINTKGKSIWPVYYLMSTNKEGEYVFLGPYCSGWYKNILDGKPLYSVKSAKAYRTRYLNAQKSWCENYADFIEFRKDKSEIQIVKVNVISMEVEEQ